MREQISRIFNSVNSCPYCGSNNVKPIVYGYPSEVLLDEAERGEVALGGCVVSGLDPDMKCNECGKLWEINHHIYDT